MKAYILAEIASAHVGNVKACKTLITDAHSAGANGVKFQIWNDQDIQNHEHYNNLKRFEIRRADWVILAKYARKLGLEVWAEVYSQDSAEWVAEFIKPDAWKIPYKLFLLDSKVYEDLEAPVFWRVQTEMPIYGTNVAIGEQGYPTTLAEAKEEVELVKYYKHADRRVLYADHFSAYVPNNFIAALAAYHDGADIIEKHICLNRKELAKESKDHYSALEPREFKDFVDYMHENERGGKVRAIL